MVHPTKSAPKGVVAIDARVVTVQAARPLVRHVLHKHPVYALALLVVVVHPVLAPRVLNFDPRRAVVQALENPAVARAGEVARRHHHDAVAAVRERDGQAADNVAQAAGFAVGRNLGRDEDEGVGVRVGGGRGGGGRRAAVWRLRGRLCLQVFDLSAQCLQNARMAA